MTTKTQSSYEIIRSLDVKSSYLPNKIGLTLYDYVMTHKPKRIVEFGVLNGYSSIVFGLAMRDLGRGHVVCYDLWEKYPYNHGNIGDVQERINSFGLRDFVSLNYGDIYEWSKNPCSHFDLLHIDVSNDGKRLREIIGNLTEAGFANVPILFEGGTKERDEKGWNSNSNNVSITSVKKELGYRVLDERFPGLSVIEPALSPPKVMEVEIHSTPTGFMMPVFKNWDPAHNGYEPKMAYITSMTPHTSKGPMMHRRKRGLVTAVNGVVSAKYLYAGKIEEVFLRSPDGKVQSLMVPENVPVEYVNHSDMEVFVLNLPNRAWYPEDTDTVRWSTWQECEREISE